MIATDRMADLAWWLIMATRQAHEPGEVPAACDPIVVAVGQGRYHVTITYVAGGE
jgi:hypothetical protein